MDKTNFLASEHKMHKKVLDLRRLFLETNMILGRKSRKQSHSQTEDFFRFYSTVTNGKFKEGHDAELAKITGK